MRKASFLSFAIVLTWAATASSAASPSSNDPLLPTIRCPVTVGVSGSKYPSWPVRQRAHVPVALASGLAVYVGGYERVVASRGWRCSAVDAADGGTTISAAPRVQRPEAGVRSWSEPACVGCIYDEVCAYFPRESATLSIGLGCRKLPQSRRVTALSKTTVRYRDADGEVGLIAFRLSGPFAAGVSCRDSRRPVCDAVLADWLSHAH